MKKTLTAAAILAALTFAGIQTVSAHNGRYSNNNGYGYGYGCGNYFTDNRGYVPEDQAALKKFREDTAAIRREIVVKRSELDALMRNDNPDETKVAQLTGDLYDLQTDLDNKAEAAGIDAGPAYEYGPGMMRGYGRHMMGW